MNMTMNMTLPYAMQAGDKSTSLLTAFTIVSKGYDLNFGGQIKRKSAVLKKDWNFGDSLMFNFWLSKLITPKSSLSLNFKCHKILPSVLLKNEKLKKNDFNCFKHSKSFFAMTAHVKYQKIDKIEGRDLSINAPTQTANPQYYGGKSTSLSTGLNIQLNHKNSLGFEYSVPLKQDLNGPQMEVKNSFNFVYEISF